MSSIGTSSYGHLFLRSQISLWREAGDRSLDYLEKPESTPLFVHFMHGSKERALFLGSLGSTAGVEGTRIMSGIKRDKQVNEG